jgi:tetratricopeptide (TPR) repeat protein
MLTFLALTLACLGYLDQARSRMDEAFSEARRLRHAHTLAQVLGLANSLDWLIGSPMAHIDELLAVSTEHGFSFFRGVGLAYRGMSLITLGKAHEGLALLAQGFAELRTTGSVVGTSSWFTGLAAAHTLLGRPAEAGNCFAEAGQIIETTDERNFEAELLHRIPGDLLNAAGDSVGAEQHYRQAIMISERQSAKNLQLRASVSLARLWRDQGKREEARDLLRPIYHWFAEGFDAPVLKDAKALLDEMA